MYAVFVTESNALGLYSGRLRKCRTLYTTIIVTLNRTSSGGFFILFLYYKLTVYCTHTAHRSFIPAFGGSRPCNSFTGRHQILSKYPMKIKQEWINGGTIGKYICVFGIVRKNVSQYYLVNSFIYYCLYSIVNVCIPCRPIDYRLCMCVCVWLPSEFICIMCECVFVLDYICACTVERHIEGGHQSAFMQTKAPSNVIP